MAFTNNHFPPRAFSYLYFNPSGPLLRRQYRPSPSRVQPSPIDRSHRTGWDFPAKRCARSRVLLKINRTTVNVFIFFQSFHRGKRDFLSGHWFALLHHTQCPGFYSAPAKRHVRSPVPDMSLLWQTIEYAPCTSISAFCVWIKRRVYRATESQRGICTNCRRGIEVLIAR